RFRADRCSTPPAALGSGERRPGDGCRHDGDHGEESEEAAAPHLDGGRNGRRNGHRSSPFECRTVTAGTIRSKESPALRFASATAAWDEASNWQKQASSGRTMVEPR